MLRMFKLAKASAIKARTQTINQLKAGLVAADAAPNTLWTEQPAADPSLRTIGLTPLRTPASAAYTPPAAMAAPGAGGGSGFVAPSVTSGSTTAGIPGQFTNNGKRPNHHHLDHRNTHTQRNINS